MTINLASSHAEQMFPLQHATTGKAVRLQLVMTPKQLDPSDTADDDQ